MVVIALINLVVITILAPTAMRLLRDYRAKLGKGEDPIFLATDMPDIKNVETWAPEDVSDYADIRDRASAQGA